MTLSAGRASSSGRSSASEVLRRPLAGRLYATALLLLVVAGAAVRLIGVGSMSLWVDEAAIANVVSRGRWDAYLRYPASNRPFGYLVASGWLAAVHNSELSLRLLSLVPSLASLALVVAVARRLLRSRAFVVLAIFSLAFSAWLVTFAKDFKPYALEHCVVLLWLWLFLRWRDEAAARPPVALMGTIALAPLFTHAPIFAAPWYGLAVIGTAVRRGRRGTAIAAVACLVLALAIALVQYRWIGSRTPPAPFMEGSSSYFTGRVDRAVAVWWAERFKALLVDFATVAREPVDGTAWRGATFLALCLLGWCLALARFVVRAEWSLFCVLVGPILTPMLLAPWFPWPFGPERVNLYAVTLVTLPILLGWELVLTCERARPARVLLALALVALQLPLDLHAYDEKYARFGSAQEELVPALQSVMEIESSSPGDPSTAACVVFNHMSSYAVRYYSTYHAELAPKLAAFRAERP